MLLEKKQKTYLHMLLTETLVILEDTGI